MRNSVITSVTMLAVLSLPMIVHAEPTVAMLWKARALEAKQKLDGLQNELLKVPSLKPSDPVPQRIMCKMMLEYAYASHIALEEMAHKKDDAGEFFHVVLNGGKEAGLFDLVYIYNWEGVLMLTRLDLLPSNWHVLFSALTPGKFQVLMPKKGCLFQFDMYRPFASEVLE